jgi:hypothetical protein
VVVVVGHQVRLCVATSLAKPQQLKMILQWLLVVLLLSISGHDAKEGGKKIKSPKLPVAKSPPSKTSPTRESEHKRPQFGTTMRNASNSAINNALVELFGEPSPMKIYDPLPANSIIRNRCTGSLAW